ncbi:MAG: glycosyltransferase [Chloroflexi bacterium CFX4]|nr:glycosyltransferase [Chloroflexi bacterium CFX4]MDL1923990.1 glycosyltransferase family 2 protein [Chloroflexi bacterium CFX3]
MPNALSIVVPVYNSEQSLPLLVAALSEAFTDYGAPIELILVNDGSRDQSWAVVQDLAARHAWITGIDLMRNYGQHNALLCGIRAAQHAIIVTMDDDLQHPPAEIHKLLAKLEEGYDVVYGTPQKEHHGLLRDLASQVTKLALQSAMGVQSARNVSAFRAFRQEVRKAFANYNSPYVSIDVLLTWGTTRFAAVAVEHAPRRYGKSNYTLRKLIAHTFNMVTGFSVMPLQLASLLGFTFTVFGIFIFLFVIVRYFAEGGSVPGFPFLASIIAIFSGVQLFSLGIIGEYLARMHFRSMDRPAYAVKYQTNPSEGEVS